MFDRINQKLNEQHNFNLKRNILRIALNAQNSNYYTEFHIDTDDDTYSIVGFLTPWPYNYWRLKKFTTQRYLLMYMS